MSATGHTSGMRIDRDAYPTPFTATYGVIPTLFPVGSPFRSLPIIDPACGRGHILRPFVDLGFPAAQLFGFEIDPSAAAETAVWTGAQTIVGDTLSTFRDWTPANPATIIMNPPYGFDSEFLQWAVALAERCNGQVAALLRLNILASKGRVDWFEAHPPKIGTLVRRPCFVRFRKRNKRGEVVLTSTDATEYAWFVWRPGDDLRPFWIRGDVASLRARLRSVGLDTVADLRGPQPPIVDLVGDGARGPQRGAQGPLRA